MGVWRISDNEHTPKGKQNMHSEQYSLLVLLHIIHFTLPSFPFT